MQVYSTRVVIPNLYIKIATMLPVFVWILAMLLIPAQSALGQQKQAKLIFAADMPIISDNSQGTYPKLGTALYLHRQSNIPTFFLFGGNSLGPSPMSTYDSGSHIVDLLNSLEPDAMGVTKREYSYYEEQLSLRAYEAGFPMIASNLYDPLNQAMQDGLVKSVLLDRGGIKLGILAVIDPAAKKQYLLQRIEILDVEESLRKESKKLRQQGADIIAVMHGKIFPEIEELIVEGIIDLSLVKDRYSTARPTLSSPFDAQAVFLTEPGDIAVVNMAVSENTKHISWQKESILSLQEEPNIAELRDDYAKRLNRLMNLPLAKVETPFNTLRNEVRSNESAFGNLITDAMVELTQSDIALINSGIIRGDRYYQTGEAFTRKSLATELPFRSGLIVVEIDGASLLQAIEDSLDEYHLNKGKFPQVANMQITFDSQRPVNERLVSITIDGKPISPKKTYKLATTDYLHDGGDGYVSFTNMPVIAKYSEPLVTIAEVVRYKLSREKIINSIEQQRIVNIGE